MNGILRIVKRIDDGVYLLDIRNDFVTYESQQWYLCTSRVPGRCSQTSIEYLAGSSIYRPTGNPGNRNQRLLPEAFAAIGEAPATTTEVRECDTCGIELPLTATYFAHPHNRKHYRTTCRACVNIERHQRKMETQRKKKDLAENPTIEGSRVVHFSKDWKPNREGMRNPLRDRMGICSSLD